MKIITQQLARTNKDANITGAIPRAANIGFVHKSGLLPCRWEGCTPEDVHLLKRFARRPDAPYLL